MPDITSVAPRCRWGWATVLATALAGVLGPWPCSSRSRLARADMTERPGNSLDDPIDRPHDLSGLSIKKPRLRVVHTTDPAQAGGSMYLQQVDPWLGYQWGRDLTQREFRERDGVYGDAGKLDGLLLPDGATTMMDRSHANSCGICHNTPYRDGGAGMTIAKNGGTGRNTPHMFGDGLVEMLGQQMRLPGAGDRRRQPRRLDQPRRGQGQTVRHLQPARGSGGRAGRDRLRQLRGRPATAGPSSTRSSTRSTWTTRAAESRLPAT